MVLVQLHLLMMVAVDDFAHGNVIVENVEHWSNVIVLTIVLVNFDSMPNVKLDSMPNVYNLFVHVRKARKLRNNHLI